MTTMEQKRAKDAWAKALEGIRNHKEKYVNVARALPALIMNSGLMQVMAFLHHKGDQHDLLACHLRSWLHNQLGTPQDFAKFMTHLADMTDARQFQNVTTEAIAWLRWLRQVAPAALLAREEAQSVRHAGNGQAAPAAPPASERRGGA